MEESLIDRREFLKLLGILPLTMLRAPDIDFRETKIQGEDLPNILVIVFDSLSATNMSLYGYPRRTTPQIEDAAREGTVYHRHYAGGNFTVPGTASLLTGTYPWSHRGFNLNGVVSQAFEAQNIFQAFSSKYHTFAYSHNTLVNFQFHQFRKYIDQFFKRSELSLLSNHYTDGFLGDDFVVASIAEELILWNQNAPPSSSAISRLDRSKRLYAEMMLNRKYSDQFPRGIPNSTVLFFTLEQAIDWMQTQIIEQPKPFLGYVHLLPPHYPYNTRKDFVGRFEDGWSPAEKPESVFSEGRQASQTPGLRRQYDEFVAYVDAEFGRLFEFLESTGYLDNNYLVLTSDHGEMFERGIWFHNTPTLYEPIVRIPLLIWSPNQNQRHDVFSPTSCVDLLPTLLNSTGHKIPEWCEGEVIPTSGNGQMDNDRSIFVIEAKENPSHAPLKSATATLIKGDFKLTYYFGYGGTGDFFELYNVVEDPEELVDLYSTHPSQASLLKDELMERLANSDI